MFKKVRLNTNYLEESLETLLKKIKKEREYVISNFEQFREFLYTFLLSNFYGSLEKDDYFKTLYIFDEFENKLKNYENFLDLSDFLKERILGSLYKIDLENFYRSLKIKSELLDKKISFVLFFDVKKEMLFYDLYALTSFGIENTKERLCFLYIKKSFIGMNFYEIKNRKNKFLFDLVEKCVDYFSFDKKERDYMLVNTKFKNVNMESYKNLTRASYLIRTVLPVEKEYEIKEFVKYFKDLYKNKIKIKYKFESFREILKLKNKIIEERFEESDNEREILVSPSKVFVFTRKNYFPFNNLIFSINKKGDINDLSFVLLSLLYNSTFYN